MANERLYQFPPKASPVPTDLLYVADSANAFDECNSTIEQVISAYPNLLNIGNLTLGANEYIYTNGSAIVTTGTITSLAVALLADTTVSDMQTTLGYTATPTANLFAGWDVNKNLSANSLLSGYATTVTAAATTTLTVSSAYQQYFTGTTTQTVTLPVTSTLLLGQSFLIVNNSTGVVTVQSSGANTIQAMASGTTLLVTCISLTGTSAASWNAQYTISSALVLPLSLANGGTNAGLTASNGGVVYSSATALAISAVGTSGQLFQSTGAGAPGWTTTTYPSTNAINTIMYASSANVLGVITPVNSAVLISSGGGVPSMSQTLPTAVQGNITQLGAQSQALNMNTHLINNVSDPVSAQDAATKNYVDQTALNGTSVYAASAASLGTVTQSGAGVGATLTNAGAQATFALDGVNPPVGSNVLIKNTATGMTSANEGIYTVTNVGSGSTNWVLTRATSYDLPVEINNTGLIVIQNGTTLAGTAWYNASTIVTVDTTAFSFSEFGNIVFPVSVVHGGTGLSSTTINQILYSSANNTIAGLATANSAVLITSAGGVPSLSTTLPSGLSATNMNLTTPTINSILGTAHGNTVLLLSDNNASAVNYVAIGNNITGNAPAVQAQGTDTNITLQLKGTGTGGAASLGTSTNDNASVGYVGEYITSTGNTTTSSGTSKTITSISLTAGDWDVRGNIFFANAGTTTYSLVIAGINTTTNTLPANIPTENNITSFYTISTAGITSNLPVGTCRISIASTTTVYLVGNCTFGVATPTMYGFIGARRVR